MIDFTALTVQITVGYLLLLAVALLMYIAFFKKSDQKTSKPK